jgi:CO/xanthine dehydrogenase Mo-binding subunit
MTAPSVTRPLTRGGVGESVIRPDGEPKVLGAFEYLGDMEIEGQLWMATRRSDLARARIVSIESAPALEMAGVHLVLTIDDVPGHKYQGQIITDQPVLADGEVRHWGEAVAVVVADDEETARLGAAAIRVELEPLDPLVDVDEALERGEIFRSVQIRHGDDDRRGDVIVEAEYLIASQDQAPLANEAGIAVPDGVGGVDVWGPTQWTHVDHGQLVACLGLTDDQVRVHISGIGGAFGAREDLSVQTHLAMAALRMGRPVKAVFDRTEGFAAHVKRHPARMRYRHEADSDGNLIRVEATLLLDGGAYHTTTAAVIANAASFAVGPYRCETTHVDAHALRTNHLPSGAMRGFGANQVMFAVEAQMDRLAAELDLDPMELRRRNAVQAGDHMSTTGQRIDDALPVTEVIDSVLAMPLPAADGSVDARLLPGGTGLTTSRSQVVRGVGYALGFKNLAFSEAFDDYAEAEVELTAEGAVVRTAAIEVGQGMVTVLQQIARTALSVEDVTVEFVDTGRIGSAGSTSASRQTLMTGGAVLQACEQLRERREASESLPLVERVRFHHRRTDEPDENFQGDLHVDFCVGAQRAVVDVDRELGLIRVVRIDIVQDVGKALNPVQVIGQIEGGIAQGLGHALMEELIYSDEGVLLNPSFTDYLLPTALDMPDVEAVIMEEPSSWGPFGAKGFAEVPTVAATPAVMAAIRDATGLALTRAPVRPEDIALAETDS